MKPKFYIRKTKDGKFYFVLTIKNGQTIMQSPLLNNKHACEVSIDLVREYAPDAMIEDHVTPPKKYSELGGDDD